MHFVRKLWIFSFFVLFVLSLFSHDSRSATKVNTFVDAGSIGENRPGFKLDSSVNSLHETLSLIGSKQPSYYFKTCKNQ